VNSHPRERKKATSLGVKTRNMSANDSSLGDSRNLSITALSRRVRSVAIGGFIMFDSVSSLLPPEERQLSIQNELSASLLFLEQLSSRGERFCEATILSNWRIFVNALLVILLLAESRFRRIG
jgi:hypothetical protein